MSKFGDLINSTTPVLIQFTAPHNAECEQMQQTIEEVALEMAEKLTIIKIDIQKNKELVEALRIKTAPTLMVYKNGVMVWRQSGITDKNSLVMIAKAFN
ncbi:thioredoxin family protein [Flavobacterium sp. xlx-214]|uniref:thioredoxin family protein n=1 Tax=unclassified Flavobacterium TaxID=196869 RepID=UPI0013D5D278|nr:MULTISPECIES: thioredoxin family protein [unclassified Flavobacterium]MBA5792978.1 thioredoxin family protein [Flavobacterium sp. xlx-221]QMI84691.1 thioredoxin family protein [Flavobacterium sp. xlx-214]